MTTPADPERVLTLDDLRHWKRTAPSLAVIGHPIAHSRSPAMHNAALAEIAKDRPQFADWVYFKFDIAPEELAGALPLFHKHRFVGLNLTLPHKVDAVKLLSFGQKSAVASMAGAVNTLLAGKSDCDGIPVDGWVGHNTDGYGFRFGAQRRLLRGDGSRFDILGSHIVVLGAGGAARSIIVDCLDTIYGNPCSSLTIVARDAGKAGELAKFFGGRAIAIGAQIHFTDFDSLSAKDLRLGAVIVNCTPLGLKPDDLSPIRRELLRPDMLVYDTTYSGVSSGLERDALDAGVCANSIERGLSMLCAQGAEALRCWIDPHWCVSNTKPTSCYVEDVMWRALGQTGEFIRQ